MAKTKTKIPTVVLDIDDTVVHFCNFLCYAYNNIHHTSITESDLTTWDFTTTKVTDHSGKTVSGVEIRQFFKDYEAHGFYTALPPIKESVLAIDFIRKMGYKVILLTARDEKYRKDTELNFSINKIQYDEIIFNAEKVKQINKLARKHNIVAFADDKYDYVRDVAETDKVNICYLINKAHNLSVNTGDDLIRVNDLLEIVRTLPNISENQTLGGRNV